MNNRDSQYRPELYVSSGFRRTARVATYFLLVASGILLMWLACAGKSHAAVSPQPQMPLILPECKVTAGSGVVDFGSRSRGQLRNTSGGMTPGTRTLQLSAVCTLPRMMKLRLDGMARGNDFSWSGADSILRIRALRAVLDGESVQLQKLNGAGNPEGQPETSLSLTPGDGLMAVRSGLPVYGKQLNVTLEVVPVLGEQDSRPLQRIYPEASLGITLMP